MHLELLLRPLTRENKQRLGLSKYRNFMFAHWAFICALLSHFFMVFIFFYIGLNIMAYVNVVSVAVFIFCLYLIHKHFNFFLSSILGYLEIQIHAGLAVYFLGWESGFQYFIFVIPVSLFFFENSKRYIFLGVLTLFNFSVLFLLLANRTPSFEASAAIINLFHLIIGVTVLVILGIIAFTFSRSVDETEDLLQIQYDRAERLLRNILPVSVGERLKEKEQLIADGFQQASILFADLQNFTKFAGSTSPQNLVQTLNELFTSFDDLLERHRVEKIKTIGDAYMVASGLPRESDRHAEQITGYALDMLAAVDDFNHQQGLDFSVRIGIHSGPVVAGVVGKKKYAYDLWGDTVNVASRMETSGAPGLIHLTESTRRLIEDRFRVTKRAPLYIKGKGFMQTYFVGRSEPLT